MIIYYIWLLLPALALADYCTEEMFPPISYCSQPNLPSIIDLNTAYTIKVPITIPAYFVSPAGSMRHSECLTQCPADRPLS